MKKRWWAVCVCFPLLAHANEQEIRLLENRFRVDPTIERAAFVIYREKPSMPVVLVRPDGTKYYAWRHPDKVSWHQEADMDIVSVTDPMPGPWQAIGRVSPDNKVRVLSDLRMQVEDLPSRLYQGEAVKFTAQLMLGDKPLNLRDFIERVDLTVNFTEFIENPESLNPDQRPQPKSLGQFSDDGTGLDETPNDGVFTVSLPINVMPGKYRARVTSGNGIFFRTLEQQVLVYPTPLMATFKQSQAEGEPHQLVVQSEQASIEPGSVSVHAKFTDTEGKTTVYQTTAEEEQETITLDIPYASTPGQYKWRTTLYATDQLSGRPLVFPLPEQTFAVTDYAALEQAEAEREAREKAMMEAAEARRQQRAREEARTTSLLIIGLGNLLVMLMGAATWFVLRKRKARKLAEAAQELEAPPLDSDGDDQGSELDMDKPDKND
ncbi:TIGR03503 family protein [Salinivibrio kushneri]|uniref:TIGR03503 family protein n=1 Tax=Salinivibrio kushneri TaxID=1908198 RepID=A0AB36K257_9GAMM|nr:MULTISPECIES: TIGR03503 family protein [Salinivibrio]ODP99221.1 TIGR03503 family protein [Salinivibrio sp. BNH]OOE40932.1 TIGR03503 family protein [Salinivibrio kushneri]QCP01535.1 TIGR03503 family protein [Salinivibrio kushneri]WBA12293.1 TIGR03503 family protein [Salinivibrio kushneri]